MKRYLAKGLEYLLIPLMLASCNTQLRIAEKDTFYSCLDLSKREYYKQESISGRYWYPRLMTINVKKLPKGFEPFQDTAQNYVVFNHDPRSNISSLTEHQDIRNSSRVYGVMNHRMILEETLSAEHVSGTEISGSMKVTYKLVDKKGDGKLDTKCVIIKIYEDNRRGIPRMVTIKKMLPILQKDQDKYSRMYTTISDNIRTQKNE